MESNSLCKKKKGLERYKPELVADYNLKVWFDKATVRRNFSDRLNQPQVPSEGDETGETADQGPEEGDDDPVVTFSNYAHCWTSSLAPFASIEHLDRGW